MKRIDSSNASDNKVNNKIARRQLHSHVANRDEASISRRQCSCRLLQA